VLVTEKTTNLIDSYQIDSDDSAPMKKYSFSEEKDIDKVFSLTKPWKRACGEYLPLYDAPVAQK
jgi:hypothetical protein